MLPVLPEILKHPKDTKISEGGDVVFNCLVEGNPMPNVRWTRNGERLNVEANTRLSQTIKNNLHTLTITGVQLSDAGQYRCVANNSIGSSTSVGGNLEVSCEYQIESIKSQTA